MVNSLMDFSIITILFVTRGFVGLKHLLYFLHQKATSIFYKQFTCLITRPDRICSATLLLRLINKRPLDLQIQGTLP